MTAHWINDLVYAPDNLFALNLTNSLLVNVTNWGTTLYYTNAVVKTTDEAALQTVGAGAHYLASGSAYRAAGSTNIPSSLLADLRQRTTYPPTVITNATISTNLTLAITALRGANALDLGYAYAPLDYVFGSNVLTNATLTIPAGVVLGTFTPGSNTHGLLLRSGANVIGSGSPTNLARIVRYNMAQEQANSAWTSSNAGAQIRVPNQHTATAPAGNFRFTDWSVPEGSPWHFDARPTNRAAFVFRDCQFSAGQIQSSVAQVAFTNCLFERVAGNSEEYPFTVTNRWYNNTFYGGDWIFYNSGSGPWEIFNNAFHGTSNLWSDAGGMPQGWNAYLPGAPWVNGTLSNGIVTNIVFQSGPLGAFYLTNTSPLLNRGRTNANLYGLYHFTTATNQTRETNSLVDIGFHYVALNAATVPVDTDGDGLADYAEDVNGNGTTEANEADVNVPDTDYDGRNDGQEFVDLTLPYDPTSVLTTSLAFFPFDETNWLGRASQAPLAKTNLVLGDGWLTKAVGIDSTNKTFLRYRDVETNRQANINLRNGAVRFWFRPGWVSGGTNGPKTPGRLIEVGTEGSGAGTNGWWALYFNTNATQLNFSSQTNNLGTNYFTASFTNDCPKNWRQVVLNYSPSNTALYVDATLVTNGAGLLYWPGTNVRANGFTVGSDTNGTNQARGIFEDLELFNYPLSTNEIIDNFQTNCPPNAIANLKMWLTAELVDLIPSGQIPQWPDQTCNGFDGIQSGAQKPFLSNNELNGRPVVRFYSTNYLRFFTFPTTWTEAEAFVVLKAENNMPSANRALWDFKGNSAAQYYPNTNGQISDDFGRATASSGSDHYTAPASRLDQPHLYNVVTRSNEWTSRINGVTHFSRPTNSVGWPSSLRYLGVNNLGIPDYFEGYVAEVLMYDRALTETERKRVERYMNQRYAFVSSAPPAPTNLIVKSVSPTQVSVSWDAKLSNTNVNFTLERKEGAGSFSVVASLRQAASHLDTGLQSNTTYTYRVKADNWTGSSGYSSDTGVTTSTNGTNLPVSAIRMWLKADSGRGNPVAFWTDQSGNGSHAAVLLRSNQVIVVENGVTNARPVLGFFATNYFHLRTFPRGWTEADGYFVLKMGQNAPGIIREQWRFGANASTGYLFSDGKVYENFFCRDSVGATPIATTPVHLYNPFSKPGFSGSWINGQPFTSYTNVFEAYEQPTIGIAGLKPFDGEMAEILLFNRVLTTNERATVEGYFNNRYSLW